MSQRTFDDFDAFADDYREIHTKNIELAGVDSFYFAAMKVRLLQPFEKNEVKQVLDIGCGDGVTELFMQQVFPHWSVKGIDVSKKSIAVAQHRNLHSAIFTWYDGSTIPLPDESVSVVFIAGVLHHVQYGLHQNLVKEIFRVLKKGGRLYLFEHNPFNPVTRYLVNTCIFDAAARLLKSGYALKLLVQNGFKIKEKRFIIFFPRKGFFSYLIFLEKYLQWLPLGGQYFIRAIK